MKKVMEFFLIIIGCCFSMFMGAGVWVFAILICPWWDMFPWFISIPLIIATGITGNAMAAFIAAMVLPDKLLRIIAATSPSSQAESLRQ